MGTPKASLFDDFHAIERKMKIWNKEGRGGGLHKWRENEFLLSYLIITLQIA